MNSISSNIDFSLSSDEDTVKDSDISNISHDGVDKVQYLKISSILDEHLKNNLKSNKVITLPVRYDKSNLSFDEIIKYDLSVNFIDRFKKPFGIRQFRTTDIIDNDEFNNFIEGNIDIVEISASGSGYSRWWLYRHHDKTLWRVSFSTTIGSSRRNSFSSDEGITTSSSEELSENRMRTYYFEQMTSHKIKCQYPARYNEYGVQIMKNEDSDIDPDLPSPILLSSKMVDSIYHEYLLEKYRIDGLLSIKK